MRNIWLLTKIQFQGFIGRLIKNRKNKSAYVGVLIVILFILLMLYVFTNNAVLTMKQCLELEANGVENGHELAMFTSSSFSILLFFFITLFRCVSPNKAKDEEMLLSMPIKKSEIIASRNLYNYLFDFSFFLIALLPSFIVYLLFVKDASAWILIRGLALIVILPFLSNGIGSILSVFFTFISRKMKRFSLFQSILSIILICAYLVLNFWTQSLISNVQGSVDDIKNKIFVIKIMMDYLLNNNLFVLLIVSLSSIGLYVLSTYLASKRLGHIMTGRVNKQDKLYFKKSSITKSLVKKELKQYFNSTVYFINTFFGGIIYFGFSVAALVLGVTKGFAFLRVIPNVSEDSALLLIFSLLLSSVVITGSSISIEGSKIWILKGNPINETTIFKAKILANIILTLIIALVSFPFMLSFVTIHNFWMFLVVPFSFSIVSSTLGLIINLKFPKMHWEREEEVIKQSLSSFLTMIIPIPLFSIGFVIYFVVLKDLISLTIFVLCYLAILFIFELLLIVWLNHQGRKLFQKLD